MQQYQELGVQIVQASRSMHLACSSPGQASPLLLILKQYQRIIAVAACFLTGRGEGGPLGKELALMAAMDLEVEEGVVS